MPLRNRLTAPERSPEGPAAQLSLLNAFELRRNGAAITLSRPAERLLAFLALENRPVLREHAAETLWLDSTQQHAHGSLRTALWKLRQPGSELVSVVGARLRLVPSLVVDVHEGLAWARAQLTPGKAAPQPDVDGLAYCGEILPDWYDDWLVLERERFRAMRVRALEMRCRRLTEAGRHAEAAEMAMAAIRCEPLRESAHRELMSVHLAEGNLADALSCYRRFRERLDRELGLAPSRRMEALLLELRDG
jgi:DNA-binding SARP family transcriptional activator